MSGMEVEVVFQPSAFTRGYEHVVKDLGKWARRNLGMPGRTDPGEFTQIIWKGEVLGLNLATAERKLDISSWGHMRLRRVIYKGVY